MVNWRSLFVGGVISAVSLYFLLNRVDVGKTRDALVRAEPLLLWLSLAVILASLIARCWRWKLLFLPQDRVGLWATTSSTLIGYMFNTVLPGRVGELVRAALVAQTERVSTARAVGTIFVEKVLDVLVLLVLLGIVSAAMPLPAWIGATGVSASVTFGALAITFFALSGRRGTVVRLVRRYVDALPVIHRARPSQTVDMLLSAADGLRHPHLLLIQLVSSTALWVLALITVWVMMQAFHLQATWTAVALVLVTTNLSMTVPSAPGYVGVYHAVAVGTLGLFGVDESAGLAFAVTMHAIAFGTFTIGGAACLLTGLSRQTYRLSDLWRWQTGTASPAATPRTDADELAARPAAQAG
ncbi:MAG: flippase-like domain-containing protein [Chloroflexi bacterium]|nr:flippase-like domain-containing protein [Chloroflexota bacterium]